MTIRRYRRDDLGAVLTLFHDTVHTINARDYTPDQLDAWAPSVPDKGIWHERLASSEAYVAEQNRKIVGFGNLSKDGWVDTLYVHKNYQREGIATAILTRLLEEAVEFDLPAVRVNASITARPLFEAHGFHLEWEQEKAHNGNVFKTFVMVIRLRH
ncbi:MAG: GNAT family N-acetyltransferase [Bacteroidetes bacterium]|nr:GNAT family N-acetyltransferase [Bacteroidota bacterium]